MLRFAGLPGLRVSLNGGVRRRVLATQPVPEREKPKLRQSAGFHPACLSAARLAGSTRRKSR